MTVNNKYKINCKYESNQRFNDWYYEVNINGQEIPEDAELMELVGQHQNWKDSNDVTRIVFESCKMTKVPRGLLKLFPNLKLLRVIRSNLTKLTKADLAEYKHLKGLIFWDNKQLEFLPGNLFDGFDNLEIIFFQKNNLKLIDSEILNGLNKLKLVDFTENPKYSKVYSSIPIFTSNATLDEVKAQLLEKFHVNDTSPSSERQDEIEKLRKLRLESRTLKIDNKKHMANTPVTSGLKNFVQQDKSFKDFRVKIDNREFHVHKLLLAARSPTFAEMLRNNPEAHYLNLVDIPIGVFEKILKFIYTDQLPDGSGSDNNTHFLDIFAAAGRLRMKELMNHAALMIQERIGPENALQVLKLSNKYGHEELKVRAFQEVKKKYPNIEFKNEWMEDGERLEAIVEGFQIKEQKMQQLEKEFKKLTGI